MQNFLVTFNDNSTTTLMATDLLSAIEHIKSEFDVNNFSSISFSIVNNEKDLHTQIRIVEKIKNSNSQIQKEFDHSEKSWFSCVETRLTIIENEITILSHQFHNLTLINKKLKTLKDLIKNLNSQFINTCDPPSTIKNQIFYFFDEIKVLCKFTHSCGTCPIVTNCKIMIESSDNCIGRLIKFVNETDSNEKTDN